MTAYILHTDLAEADTNWIVPQVQSMRRQDGLITEMVLDPETLFTDIVSQNYLQAPGLLTSEAFRSAVEDRELQPHEWRPIDLHLRGEIRRHWWMEMRAALEPQIDYGASLFVIEHDGAVRVAELSSADELTDLSRRLVESIAGEIRAKSIVFLPGQAVLDLFVLQLTTRTFFITEQLVRRLEGLTGFKLRPADVEVTYT